MSSPLSNLRKTHKAPFLGSRPMPFRHPEYTEDESKLLEEITQKMVQEKLQRRDPFSGGLPRLDKGMSFASSVSESAASSNGASGAPTGPNPPTDQELMHLMMRRVATLEQRTKDQAKELTEKDMKIKILEDKIKIYKKVQAEPSKERTRDLEKRCLLLQQQVQEMEDFLADYGMVWVGDRENSGSSFYNEEEMEGEEAGGEGEGEEKGTTTGWTQTGTPLWMDFDTFVENIQDLNILAGEGVARVQRTTGGAKFKIPDSIPLTVYANGIALYSGPFRPYGEATTQRFVRDVLDGYFPSELQERHPEGVPFALHDLRSLVYQDSRHRQQLFQGSGRVLGGEDGQSRLVSPPGRAQGTVVGPSVAVETTHQLPGQQITTEQLLNRLPRSVVKSGKVIDIRSSVAETLQGFSGRQEVALVETSVTKEMKERLESAEKRRPSTPRDITTLRIKTGESTLIVKMKFRETVGDLRNYLKQHRPSGAPMFEIYSAYPSQVYSDDKKTLEECDLVPNAVLHLRPLKR